MDFGRRNKVSAEANMSSISDLVFLLLIFFIIMSTMAVNGEMVNLPKTSTGQSVAGAASVTITKEGEYMVNNLPVTKEQVKEQLEILMAGKPADKRTVILNVDRDVPTGETIELFSTLKVLQCNPVIATRGKKEE
ncbi:MAG: ExbD/TolR family protein [Flavobacteriales bacterium]|jgi:biopolymer transport protein ExbD